MNAVPTILVAPSQGRGSEFADASISLSHRYPQALVDAGALPWVMPWVKSEPTIAECVRRCDGVLLSGGDDVDPRLYTSDLPRQLRATVQQVDPERDWLDQQVIGEVFRQQKPLLAICRGQQILNVALGGTLIVDIPSQVPGALTHNQPQKKCEPVHEVSLTPGSLLAKMTCRDRLGVNSTHHQAVDRVASSLQATARSPDGVVEALELAPSARGRVPFLVAVQFHPERLYERVPECLALLRHFVRACEDSRLASLI